MPRELANRANDRLHRGEFTSVEEALQTLIAAYRYERRLSQELTDEFGDPDNTRDVQFWDEEMATVERCLAAYQTAYQAAIVPLITTWSEDPDEQVRDIAYALRTGDYSILAF